MPEPTLDFTDEDYRLWKHHPVSKGIYVYWARYRAHLIDQLIARWLSGSLSLLEEREIRGRVLWIDEMISLPFEAIQSFMEQTEEKPDEGTNHAGGSERT